MQHVAFLTDFGTILFKAFLKLGQLFLIISFGQLFLYDIFLGAFDDLGVDGSEVVELLFLKLEHLLVVGYVFLLLFALFCQLCHHIQFRAYPR